MKSVHTCPLCLGSGVYRQGDGGYNHISPECGKCGGKGVVINEKKEPKVFRIPSRRDSTQGDTHTDPSDGNTGCARGQG